MKNVALLVFLSILCSGAYAQVSVDVSGYGVRIQKGSNEAGVNSNSVASDVEMEGVAVINGEVFIDGNKVSKGKTLYSSKKSGKTYRITWGKDGNVSVAEK